MSRSQSATSMRIEELGEFSFDGGCRKGSRFATHLGYAHFKRRLQLSDSQLLDN